MSLHRRLAPAVHIGCLAVLSCVAVACRRAPPPLATAAPKVAVAAKSEAEPAFPPGTVVGSVPPSSEPLQELIARLGRIAHSPDLGKLEAELTRASLRRLTRLRLPGGPLPVTAPTLLQRLEGPVQRVAFLGGRAIFQIQGKTGLQTSYFYLEQGRWKLDLADSRPPSEPTPGLPDPLNLPVALTEATAGIAGTGALIAVLDTSEGPITCTLEAELAPNTVANFVGLARGLRASLRVENHQMTRQWQRRPFYDDMPFGRAVPDTLVEMGDPIGKGRGTAGYQIADEFDLRLRHDRAGVLSMAQHGANTASSRFILTARPLPDLDDRQTIFGHCREIETIARISRMPEGKPILRGIGLRRGG